LPHYVTFQTDYQIFKSAQKYTEEKKENEKGVEK
jgi:alpha-D-ribose 1-methylphosphonate 5-triphosphate synthase subunit PhnI